MSKEINKSLLPNLRFPEFAKKPTWKERRLSEVLFEHDERSSGKEEVFSVSVHKGVINQIEHLGRSFSASNTDNYKRVLLGDIIYTKSPTGDFPYGIIKQSKVAKPVIVSPLYGVFKPETTALGVILDAYFEYPSNVYNYLSSIIQKGAKNTINVTNDTFLSKSLIVPIDKVEQQKIADCLSSLDELINAENQKLEALQQHKKGLLQQLFPAEGEKIPKVRFREFKDCGEWEETELGQLGQLISGLTYSPEDVRSNGLLVLRSSNIKNSQIVLEDCVFVSQELKGANLTAPNDILICVRNGSKSLIGKNALLPNNLPFSTHGAFMTVFRANNPKFVFQLFQSGLFKKQVDADLGATINSINGSQLVKYKFTTPMPNEQKRIADFLSSVDRLILAQGTKVEKLKSHKKGLMQQLFPNMN